MNLEFLEDATFFYINKKAQEGTLIAHYEGNVPNLIFNIPDLTPYYIGQLLYIFEESCAISGYILDVNPFNQPGVEAYKNNMFSLLNKPDEKYKNIRIKLEEKLKSIPKGKTTN